MRYKQLPLLSAEEEVALAQRVKQGDQKARDALVEHNYGYAIGLAKPWSRDGDFQDILQAAVTDLVEAADRFDDEAGTRFTTYARHWILMEIHAWLRERPAIHTPVYLEREEALAKAVTEAQAKTRAECLEHRRRARRPIKYFALTASDDDEIDQLEAGRVTLPTDPRQADPHELAVLSEDLDALAVAFGSLLQLERVVLARRFGLGCDPMSMRDIAHETGLSAWWLYQVQDRALRRLRQILSSPRSSDLFAMPDDRSPEKQTA